MPVAQELAAEFDEAVGRVVESGDQGVGFVVIDRHQCYVRVETVGKAKGTVVASALSLL